MHDARITGIGSYLPKSTHTNETLPSLDPPMSLEDMNRIGVMSRGWAAEDEGVCEMATNAARRALGQAGVSAESLDFIILANWTERRYVPDFAPDRKSVV